MFFCFLSASLMFWIPFFLSENICKEKDEEDEEKYRNAWCAESG
jgi:hypothetical protein